MHLFVKDYPLFHQPDRPLRHWRPDGRLCRVAAAGATISLQLKAQDD